MKIQDVKLIRNKINPDHRGSLSTIFSRTTDGLGEMTQWNRVSSHANVLRGMHVHLIYDELYVPIAGRLFFLLKDARQKSVSFNAEMSFYSDEVSDCSIVVPVGVAHGVYFVTEGILIYGLSNSWTGEQEFGFRWNDGEVQTRWPAVNPILSQKDASAGSFAEMVERIKTSRASVE